MSGHHQPLRTPENLHSVQRRSGSAAKLSRRAHGVSKEWRRHEAWLIDPRERFRQEQEQGVKIHGHQQCPRIEERALRRSARRLARTKARRSSRFRAPDRRPPSSFVGPRRPALHDRRNGGRHRLRPQYRRDRLCRLPLDVSRPRPGSVPPRRRGRICQRRRGDERERRLRPRRDLRRHRQPRQSVAR